MFPARITARADAHNPKGTLPGSSPEPGIQGLQQLRRLTASRLSLDIEHLERAVAERRDEHLMGHPLGVELAFDPASGKVFVSNNKGRGVAVVDVQAAQALPGINIGGGAGNTQWDAESGHVFAAVHGSSAVVDIDPAKSRSPGVSRSTT
jgi:hypothetical protein